jgi:hypothetical protein
MPTAGNKLLCMLSSVMLIKYSAVCRSNSTGNHTTESWRSISCSEGKRLFSGPVCARKCHLVLYTLTWSSIVKSPPPLLRCVFFLIIFHLTSPAKTWTHCLRQVSIQFRHLQIWICGGIPCNCVCSASQFCVDIPKDLIFLLPHQSFCTFAISLCGFGWRATVMDAFYFVLTDLSFISNFTAEHWYNESTKWYEWSEWGWSHLYEYWWGLCSIRIFHNKEWSRGEPCFEIFFIVVMVVRSCVYVHSCVLHMRYYVVQNDCLEA